MNKNFTVNMEKVEELSTQKFWSLSELAKKANLSSATIFALKSGRRHAGMKTVRKIADTLQVEPNEIIM